MLLTAADRLPPGRKSVRPANLNKPDIIEL
jgi:hypothetical protein